MSKQIVRAAFISVLMAVFVPNAFATLINFDDVANGTVINNHYAGVTFSNPLGPADIYARTSSVNNSPSNVVSVFQTGIPAFDARFGAVEVLFSQAQKFVSIDAAILRAPEGFGNPTNYPKLEIYDSALHFLTAVAWNFNLTPQPGAGGLSAFQTLSFDAGTNNIGKVRFLSGQPNGGPSNFGYFDNLNYTVVPVPAAFWLFGTALSGFGLFGRNKRRLAA